MWWPALGSLVLAVGVISYWLWTGRVPEKDAKDVGLGLKLPTYVSGPASISWWAMCITMLADLTAFMSLVFGYFFFWTIHSDFPPDPAAGPGVLWPATSGCLLLGAWGLTVLARRWNRRDQGLAFHVGLLTAVLLSLAGGGALLVSPWLSGLDPQSHVYPATVWLLVLWTVVHVAVGVYMQLYCVASRLAGRMSARHNSDITNVALYWHFMVLTALITVAVIAGFPLVA